MQLSNSILYTEKLFEKLLDHLENT